MRIVVNSRLLVPTKMDGIGKFTLESFKRICAKHPEHHFTFVFDRKVEDFDFGSNTENVQLPPPARHPILWLIWFEWSLKRYINQNHFDLFISPEGWVPPKLNCKSLAVMHDLNFFHQPEHVIFSHRKFLQHFFPRYAKRADRIATVSSYSKKDISNTLQVSPKKIDVVYNGISDGFKKLEEADIECIRTEFSEGKEYFIFVGSLHPRKNLKNLFLAFDQFKKESRTDHKLMIVGNRKWWPKDLEAIYQEMNFRSDVIFIGRASDQQLSELMAAASALTYVPHFEGFGIPILEAFASEVPVITANNTSLPEVAGEAALLCDSNSPASIAAAMDQLNKSESLRESLIEKGSERLKDFSWERTSDLLWESAQKCLDG